jgi:hypothetical protein
MLYQENIMLLRLLYLLLPLLHRLLPQQVCCWGYASSYCHPEWLSNTASASDTACAFATAAATDHCVCLQMVRELMATNKRGWMVSTNLMPLLLCPACLPPTRVQTPCLHPATASAATMLPAALVQLLPCPAAPAGPRPTPLLRTHRY